MLSTQTSHRPRTARFGSLATSGTATLLLLLALLFAYPLLAGCNSADSNYPRTGILLTEEPDGVRTVLEVREALLGPEATEHQHAGHEHSEQEHADHDTVHDADHDTDHDADHDNDQPHELDGSEQGHQHADHDAEQTAEQTDAHVQSQKEPAKPVAPAGPMEVVVVGQIGGLTNPWQQTEPAFPFVEGMAKFFLADPGAVAEHQAGGHGHAPGEDCAFCASHAKDSSALLAVVQFKDKQGQILRRDARRWFALQGNETVVVHGQARIVAGGLLVVDADSLYVRR